ncbi:MAG: ParB/RepB/Spo0J family partition protein [Christensenellales bacterium]
MARQTGLGRGLEMLMGNQIPDDADAFAEIDIRLIDPNPGQPRRSFDSEKLDELAKSIKTVGIISPIVVVKNDGRYTIISGERRFRASIKAKLSHIPAIIRDYDAIKRMEVALIENLQRDDLNPLDEAAGIQALIDECAITQEQAAERLGKSRSAVTNSLRLLDLDETTALLVVEGKLSAGHARALLGIDDDSDRAKLAIAAAQQQLSVRQVEEQVRNLKKQTSSPKTDKVLPEEFKVMESAFKKALGSSVKIKGTPRKGKISIEYKSFDEFERIYNIISGLEE